MGSVELRDLDAVAWVSQQPWADKDRIGVWGWSYGGYFTAYALTHSKIFRAGIAGAPVTDWHNYDAIYTERYMDLPQNNRDGTNPVRRLPPRRICTVDCYWFMEREMTTSI